jgi:hypothetical protein
MASPSFRYDSSFITHHPSAGPDFAPWFSPAPGTATLQWVLMHPVLLFDAANGDRQMALN